MKTIHPRKQSGSSLVVVISVLATLMVIVGVAAEYTHTVNRHVQRSNTLQSAIAVGDSCIDMLFSNWRKICTAPPNQTQPLPTSSFQDPLITVPTSTQFPDIPGFGATATDYYGNNTPNPPTISNYKVVAADAEWQPMASSAAAPIPMLGQIDGTITAIEPTTSVVYNYIASADVTLPALGPVGSVVAKVRRVFQKEQMSPWNFAIFYIDPLEIHPGAPFTVTGWVHTNSDLYTGHNLLTFADKVTYGDDWSVGFKPGDGQHPETPTSPNYPANLPPAYDDPKQPFGLDPNSIFNPTDANPNNDSFRELIEPPSPSPDPLADQRYWNQAGVVIEVDNSNNVVIGRPEANGTITPFTSLISNPLTPPLAVLKYQALNDMFNTSGAITTDQSIQDDRENKSIRLVTLDLSKIQNNPTGLNPTFKANDINSGYFNGIVYIYDKSATSSARRGVRLKNGSKISSRGLTIASSNPVYIQGDYNTGRKYDGSTTPPSNNAISDPLTPQVVGYNNLLNPSGPGVRAPCSVLADAVTILSNSWVDSAAGTEPPASNTTVNAGIISGIVATAPVGGDGSYSGGAENFPRFLETWTNKKFTYYGSMVELYPSQQSIGKWGTSGVYSPPDRQWYFDNNFKLRPPPGSLMVYSYIKGKWSVL